ncbi:hypothetical protein Glove_256g190 [Diversispora epigaea]|uniref:Sel1 repeat protein n=1 Tax=Diversispora epigaea TaxID=1348612 RepID=A0A397I7M1_9GLOM|nr:hypothetical protein Glove_256g190 [Diversispora epigaea]
MSNVGDSYENGIGVSKDKKEAFKWYLKAAEKEHNKSQYAVETSIYEGCGIKKDIVNVIHWLNKSIENGNTSANELLEEIINMITS